MRKLALMSVILALLLVSAGSVVAQDDTDDDTTTGPQSTVSIFFVTCETQAVMNLAGTMQEGFDVYFQIFPLAGGLGDPVTLLRRINAEGEYTFSEIVPYPEGVTVPAASFGSAYVSISVAGDPDNSVYNEFVDDIQDGCGDPLYPLGISVDTSSTVSAPTDDGSRGPGTNSEGTSTILSPFGGVLNPGYIPPLKPIATIGTRDEFELVRQDTPGLIFAECDAYPVAEPGLIYDSDEVIIFWSWFAETEEQVIDHINNANYSVTYYQVLELPNVIRTTVREIDGLFWVFYYSNVGNLLPGQYWIEYKLSWDTAISDGFAEFGPGTDTPLIQTGCSFDVFENPNGITVNHNTWPYRLSD